MRSLIAVTLALLLSVTAASAQPVQKDAKGCQDHPIFTRMPDYWIHSCEQKQFDAHDFVVGANKKTERVEGQVWIIRYYPQAALTSKPSELQIQRNFQNALTELGGSVVWSDKSRSTLKLIKDGTEIWVEVTSEFTGKHGLRIVQKQAMAQDIVANAEAFAGDLRTTGHAAIYGILFDTGKSTIKPESAQAIAEVARLLKTDAALKVHVVGHTDNVGGIEANITLSQARAEAVMQALVRDHGIAAPRLRAFGCGVFAPVASNDTEEGRAKNRRVELVKQ